VALLCFAQITSRNQSISSFVEAWVKQVRSVRKLQSGACHFRIALRERVLSQPRSILLDRGYFFAGGK